MHYSSMICVVRNTRQGPRLTLVDPYPISYSIVSASITPQQMIAMAERHEQVAQSLRQTAAALLGLEGPSTPSPVVTAGMAEATLKNRPQFYGGGPSVPIPTVKVACIQAFEQSGGRPLHVTQLFEFAKQRGAKIKDVANLSSMLSKDYKNVFQIAPGKRGYWEPISRSAPSPTSIDLEFAKPVDM